ncbi:MAG: DUF6110 family protein [Coriobacteriales bacterium]|jgi:hypothetical protein|nr:DUF6110 family protein [Coriobacteriales bacterium]
MAFSKEIGLIAAGFALGTIGVKAATSATAKKLCVQAVSKGLQARAAGQDIIEQAKSNVDDIVAEASYLNQQEAAGATGAAGAEAAQEAPAGAGAESTVRAARGTGRKRTKKS